MESSLPTDIDLTSQGWADESDCPKKEPKPGLERLRVGVLGLGSIGLRHSQNLISLGHEVLGFDPDEGRQSLLASYGGRPTTRESVFACDRLVVATPTPSHWGDLQETRIPTLAEKPIADKPLEFSLNHITLVGYNLRYHSCVKQAAKWLTAGFIGAPLYGNFVLAQYNAKPDYLRDGVILNWSHEIDLCLHLMGPASHLARVQKNKIAASLFLDHNNGTSSAIHLNYINKNEERYFTILGDRGKIHCVLAPYRVAECHCEDGSVYAYTFDTTFDEDYVTEIKAFLSGDIGPGCTAKQAVDVLNICLGT